MTIKIQNLTAIIYGWMIGILMLIPDMINTFMHLKEEWLMLIFYIGCLYLIIPFIKERHQAVQQLDDTPSFTLLYKHELIIFVLLCILAFIPNITLISILIGAYHFYWVYKNYSTFRFKKTLE